MELAVVKAVFAVMAPPIAELDARPTAMPKQHVERIRSQVMPMSFVCTAYFLGVFSDVEINDFPEMFAVLNLDSAALPV